jgi:transcriptional regulator with AAA-type ATPase domain
LGKMIGMQHVNRQLQDLIDTAKVDRRRVEEGYPPSNQTMHLVFTGPPGTGKTTVAEQIAPLYHALGLIPTDKIVIAKPSDLIAPYQGQTPEKTRKVLESAHGGVLFIDEAYGLVENGEYGKQALTEMVADMDKHRKNSVVILAGYPHEIEELKDANQGLRSRLPTDIDFPAYTVSDSQKIAHSYAAQDRYTYAQGVRSAIDQAVAAHATGNARETRNLYGKIVTAQKSRLVREHGVDIPAEHLPVLKVQDVERGRREYLRGRPPRGALVKKPKKPAKT